MNLCESFLLETFGFGLSVVPGLVLSIQIVLAWTSLSTLKIYREVAGFIVLDSVLQLRLLLQLRTGARSAVMSCGLFTRGRVGQNGAPAHR